MIEIIRWCFDLTPEKTLHGFLLTPTQTHCRRVQRGSADSEVHYQSYIWDGNTRVSLRRLLSDRRRQRSLRNLRCRGGSSAVDGEVLQACFPSERASDTNKEDVRQKAASRCERRICGVLHSRYPASAPSRTSQSVQPLERGAHHRFGFFVNFVRLGSLSVG